MQWVREKFGTLLSGAIIGLIALVFTVSGMFSPKATRGLHEGSVAGTVNGDAISISEFNRALNQRMEFFKNLGGGKMSDEQLKAFHIREGVFQELVRRKLMEQEATRQGLEASDAEVMDRIRDIAAFQKDGQFDYATYKQTLEANNYTPGSFETMVRTDLSSQAWQTYFQNRIRVSELELKRQFETNENKREIKYVLLTPESASPGGKVDPTKVAQTDKLNEKLGDQVAAAMTADKSSDAKVNAILKPYKVAVKSTGPVTSESPYLPGVGEASEILKDAFADKSPINPAQGGKAKKYVLANRVLVAVVTQAKKADPAQFETQKAALIRQVSSKKQREVYEDWFKKVQAKAKIDPNPSVITSDT